MEDQFKERLRALTRPVLLVLFAVMGFIFEINGFEGTYVTAVQGLAIAGAGEWIIERPVLKALGKT